MNNTYTEDQIRMMLQGRETVVQMAKDYFWTRYNADSEWDHSGEYGFEGFRYDPYIEVDFDGETVEVSAEAAACGRGCCGNDHHTYKFPLSYLWLDQTAILADMKEKAETKKKAAKDQKLADAEKAKKATEDQERKEFLRLSAKYKK